jgi:hypothetical protein
MLIIFSIEYTYLINLRFSFLLYVITYFPLIFLCVATKVGKKNRVKYFNIKNQLFESKTTLGSLLFESKFFDHKIYASTEENSHGCCSRIFKNCTNDVKKSFYWILSSFIFKSKIQHSTFVSIRGSNLIVGPLSIQSIHKLKIGIFFLRTHCFSSVP